MTGDTPPDYVQKTGRNFANLLETPILFYLARGSRLLHSQIDSALMLNLAWLYVGFRLAAHTAIHISYNYVTPSLYGICIIHANTAGHVD